MDSIFTPPWNRCTQDTIQVLIELEFTAISRDHTAQPLEANGLCEVPVNIDWLKKRNGRRVSYEDLGLIMGRCVLQCDVVGLMLHHELMDHTDRAYLTHLLKMLKSHPSARCVRMANLQNFEGSRELENTVGW